MLSIDTTLLIFLEECQLLQKHLRMILRYFLLLLQIKRNVRYRNTEFSLSTCQRDYHCTVINWLITGYCSWERREG